MSDASDTTRRRQQRVLYADRVIQDTTFIKGYTNHIVLEGTNHGGQVRYPTYYKMINGAVETTLEEQQSYIDSVPDKIRVPNSPTDVSASPGDGEATISFTPPTNNGGAAIISYLVTSSPGGITASGTSSPIVVTGLTNGETYTFIVQAINRAGKSAPSSPSAPIELLTTPDAPTAVSGVRGNGQVSVSFTASTSDGGSAILDYTATAYSGATQITTATGSGSPIVVTGLTNGTPYTFTSKARNALGYGPESDPSSAVTPVTTPAAPTSLVATPGNTSASIAFTAGANNGSAITNYEYSTDNGSTYYAFSPAQTSSPVSITGLTNGVAYTIRLKAVNGIGAGTESSSVSVTPAVPINGSPRILILGDTQGTDVESGLNSAKADLGYTGTMTFTRKNVFGVDSGYTGSDLTTSNYDVVLLYTNGGSTPSSTLGTNINNFIAAGGHFIMGVFAWGNVTAFPNLNYTNNSTYVYKGTQTSNISAITIVVSHPIFNKIDNSISINTSCTASMTLTSSATSIGAFSNNSNSFLAVRESGSARLVGMNAYFGVNWTTNNSSKNIYRYMLNSVYWCIGSLT